MCLFLLIVSVFHMMVDLSICSDLSVFFFVSVRSLVLLYVFLCVCIPRMYTVYIQIVGQASAEDSITLCNYL